MDSMPQLYLNGTALKGYDYEKQLYITSKQLLEMVLKGDLHPRNECGEYILQEPTPSLRKLELFLKVIPHNLLRIEDEDGTSISVTRYEDGGSISATVYNHKKDGCTGGLISHAKQLEKYAVGDKYIYEHYKTAVMSWLREQIYDLPMIYEWDVLGEMDFIEIKINGRTKKMPVAFYCATSDRDREITPLLGCRLPFTEGDEPLVPSEIMRKMPLLHYKLAKAANQPDAFLIEIAKQGLQDVGYNGPMPAISSVDAMEKVKHYGSQRANDREKATGAAYDKIHDQLINLPELPPYHWNGKLYRRDFLEYLEKNTATGKFHTTIALSKWKSLKEEVGEERIGTGRKP